MGYLLTSYKLAQMLSLESGLQYLSHSSLLGINMNTAAVLFQAILCTNTIFCPFLVDFEQM